MVPNKDYEIWENGKLVSYKAYKCHGGAWTLPYGVAFTCPPSEKPHEDNINDIMKILPNLKDIKLENGKIDYPGIVEHLKANGLKISRDKFLLKE